MKLFGLPVVESHILEPGEFVLGDWSAYMKRIPLLHSCARCGETHANLEFKKLTRPMIDGDGRWTHWAACPTNGEPILMRFQEIDETDEVDQ